MVKVPKDLQQKKKSAPKRPQAKPTRTGDQQYGSRAMRRKMQQQGISMEPIEANRVIFELDDKNLVIEQPEVFKMTQVGQDIYQVIGSAEEKPIGISSEGGIHVEEPLETSEIADEELELKITDQDIMLVASQANVSLKEAEAALEDVEGNIAKAIIFLKNRP